MKRSNRLELGCAAGSAFRDAVSRSRNRSRWVHEIGALYQHNDQRLALTEDASAYAEADRLLRAQVEHLRQRFDRELAEPKLRLQKRKALTSLQDHRGGLTVFVDHQEVPMDNNEAERRQRGPVVGRKTFMAPARCGVANWPRCCCRWSKHSRCGAWTRGNG